MGKKSLIPITTEEDAKYYAMREVQKMRHRDLQRACICRGMPFQEVENASTPDLITWFTNHYNNGKDDNLIDEYDGYIESILVARGHTRGKGILHPTLRLGYSGDDTPGTDDIRAMRKQKEPAPVKEIKPKREKDEETGMVKGTKKHLTSELFAKGIPLPEVIKKVLEKFPDAQEKSIKIWYNRLKPKK